MSNPEIELDNILSYFIEEECPMTNSVNDQFGYHQMRSDYYSFNMKVCDNDTKMLLRHQARAFDHFRLLKNYYHWNSNIRKGSTINIGLRVTKGIRFYIPPEPDQDFYDSQLDKIYGPTPKQLLTEIEYISSNPGIHPLPTYKPIIGDIDKDEKDKIIFIPPRPDKREKEKDLYNLYSKYKAPIKMTYPTEDVLFNEFFESKDEYNLFLFEVNLHRALIVPHPHCADTKPYFEEYKELSYEEKSKYWIALIPIIVYVNYDEEQDNEKPEFQPHRWYPMVILYPIDIRKMQGTNYKTLDYYTEKYTKKVEGKQLLYYTPKNDTISPDKDIQIQNWEDFQNRDIENAFNKIAYHIPKYVKIRDILRNNAAIIEPEAHPTIENMAYRINLLLYQKE